ncbi:MAG: prolyl oligopeptidase family serine peptidase, partial [Pirellula sp.]
MFRHWNPFAIFLLQSLWFAGATQGQDHNRTIEYPKSKVVSQSDDYHGTKVDDPFRWLEDVDSEDTKNWVVEQNKTTFAYLDSIKSRDRFKQRLTSLWNFERYGLPRQYGANYFFTYNNGLQNQNVLYISQAIDDRGLANQRLLLDPNLLSKDGTVALSGYVPSDDGRYLAYGVAESGSDWNTWKVRETHSATDLEDTVRWVKFSSVSWTSDHKGFFYSRYDEPKENEFTGINYYQKLYYHRIGTPQSDDILVYDRPDQKEWGFSGTVSDDGSYLVISVWRGTEKKNLVFYAAIVEGKIPTKQDVVELVGEFNADWQFLGNDKDRFYFETDESAPRHRIVAIDLAQPQRTQWTTIVPESDESIESSSLIGNRLLVHYLKDATSVVKEYSTQGVSGPELKIPSLGTVAGFEGKRSSTETFYTFTNYITPPTVFRLDLGTLESTVWKAPKLDFDPANYITERVFYRSKDGTRIPMILSRKKGVEIDGGIPTILYGYGGFNISITPNFSPANLAWMEQGGMYAVANLRGGGEYGRDWHESGMLDKKQTVFDDFIAAAEFLIKEKYTSSSRLAISGRSNGGLLVGAAMTQRPDLFAVALPAVGVMDMLRFHQFTIGWAWVSEFGSSENADQFRNLLIYSPLHRLKPGTRYPATLITTGDHDDRVVPGHSYKFAARLQSCQSGTRPTLIRIET